MTTELNDNSRLRPPQATATEAVSDMPDWILLAVDELVRVMRYAQKNMTAYPYQEELDGFSQIIRRRYEKRTETAPNDAAGGEAGRLVAWAADPEHVMDGDDSYPTCQFCGFGVDWDVDKMSSIPHAPDCLHLWAETQLAASSRPEAEDGNGIDYAQMCRDAAKQLADRPIVLAIIAEFTRRTLLLSHCDSKRIQAESERDAARDALATAVAERDSLAAQLEQAEQVAADSLNELELLKLGEPVVPNEWDKPKQPEPKVYSGGDPNLRPMFEAAPQPSTDATGAVAGG